MNVAVITGASMGLGEEFARQLAARKTNLVLVARSEELLRRLAAELEERYRIRAFVCACDLSRPGASREVADFIKAEGVHPTWLINNAGFGLVGDFGTMDSEKLNGMLMVNMVALVELTHLLLPSLRLGRSGRIINVASTAAFQPVPYFNVYAATKAFVLNFSEALHEELRSTDVRVLALCPGPTPTRFALNNNINPKLFEKGQSPSEVVRMGLRASESGRAVLICQRLLAIIAQRFIPRIVVRQVAAIIARSYIRRMDK